MIGRQHPFSDEIKLTCNPSIPSVPMTRDLHVTGPMILVPELSDGRINDQSPFRFRLPILTTGPVNALMRFTIEGIIGILSALK